MNWTKFKSDGLGMRVELEPRACFVGEEGRDMQSTDHDWLVLSFPQSDVVTIQNVATSHIAELGKDHIYDFRSNPIRSKGGARYGFLVLKMQLFVQGNTILLRPNRAPGESVAAAERIAQLEREAARLRAAVAPRRLQRWQHDAIASGLRGQTFQVFIGTVGHDAEAIALWQDITDAVKEAGLDVVAHTSWQLAQGVSITPSGGSAEDRAAVKAAFMAAGIELWEANGQGMSLNRLELIVGSKSPPVL